MGLKNREKTKMKQSPTKAEASGEDESFYAVLGGNGNSHPLLPGKPPCVGRDVPWFLLDSNNSTLPSVTSVVSRLRVELCLTTPQSSLAIFV